MIGVRPFTAGRDWPGKVSYRILCTKPFLSFAKKKFHTKTSFCETTKGFARVPAVRSFFSFVKNLFCLQCIDRWDYIIILRCVCSHWIIISFNKMVKRCIVCLKEETQSTTSSFHRFPADKNLQQLWLTILDRPDLTDVSNYKVCESFFFVIFQYISKQ
jgi:hypothetical protein